MTNNIISKFQMKSFKTHRFNLSVPSSESYSKLPIEHSFSGKYMSQYLGNRWIGMIMVHYSAKANNENDPFSLDIVMDGVYESIADNTPTDEAQFKKMLTMNGAVALFSILRGQVATATTSLGLNPGLIVPSVNLNNFQWEEQSPPPDDE